MNRQVVTSNKIANLKKSLRGSAEIEYLDARKQLDIWEQKLMEKQVDLVEAEKKLMHDAGAQVSILEMQSWQQYIDLCHKQIAELKQRVNQCNAVCQTKHDILVVKYMDEQKWIEYRDRLVLLQKKSFDYAEQKFLDELTVQRNSRLE